MTFGQCRALLPAAACCDTSLQGARQSIAETTTGDELIVCASSAKVRRLSTAAADVASRQTALLAWGWSGWSGLGVRRSEAQHLPNCQRAPQVSHQPQPVLMLTERWARGVVRAQRGTEDRVRSTCRTACPTCVSVAEPATLLAERAWDGESAAEHI